MTQFNPENKETLTYGESLGPAMQITDQEDADQYLDAYVDFLYQRRLREGKQSQMNTLRALAKTNLGYYAGYYDSETRERVERLFKCQHPVFGSIADNGAPTTEQALEAGIDLGEQIANGTR